MAKPALALPLGTESYRFSAPAKPSKSSSTTPDSAASMNIDQQNNGASTEANSSPTAHNVAQLDLSQISSTVGNSVVHDLMRVYESLTQSSTPQVTFEDASGKPGAPGPGGYDAPPVGAPYGAPGQIPPTSSFPVPPPPMYHTQPPGGYPPSQQQPPVPHQPYYGDYTYSHQPNTTDHPPQHGYMLPEHDSNQSDREDSDEDEEEDPEESGRRSKRRRRGSDSSNGRGQKGRKKSKAADGRWSKRFTWPEDLHRDFVSAIFDVGLKHSSPSTILEHMPKHEQITAERIKSHLQKYRMHRVKSKKEFISSYEASLRNFKERGLTGVKSVSGSEMAAHLTYQDMNNGPAVAVTPKPSETRSESKPGMEALMLPKLTEAEKASPMGSAMGYLMGLFFSLKQQLMVQRAAEAAQRKAETPVQAVFSSFVGGGMGTGAPSPDSADGTQPYDPNAHKQASQSIRTNIEENSIMKREMQSQMALQNKMRALKQQELNKYKNLPGTGETHADSHMEEEGETMQPTDNSRIQGAGETAGNDDHSGSSGRNQQQRSLSIGASEEFWQTDVVDEQLFEFLMNS